MRRWMAMAGVLAMMGFGPAACEVSGYGAAPEPNEAVKAAAREVDAEVDGESTAVFAGGCFWCVEAVFEQFEGVSSAVSGYAGGEAETATYPRVTTGRTRHAEAVRVTYDPKRIGYAQLLHVFFSTHDPTTVNRQGADVGPQYRSAVFFANEAQKRAVGLYIEQLNEAKAFGDPVVTTLEPLEEFYEAEAYHQDYVEHNPRQPYVRAVSVPKVAKAQKYFPDLLKDAPATQPAE